MNKSLSVFLAACLFGIAGVASADRYDDRYDRDRSYSQERWDRGDRDHDRWDRRDRWDGRNDRWDGRRDRHDRWDDRRDRWEARRYYHQGRYYTYGRYRSPYSYRYPSGWRSGYSWSIGHRLPPSYRDRYYVVDYRPYDLPPPPRGYYWYRVGNDVVLAAIATGIITQVLPDLFY